MANFIHSTKKCQIRDFKGRRHTIEADYIGDVPDWVRANGYFNLLVKDGTISVVGATEDADKVAEAAAEAAEQARAEAEAKAQAEAEAAEQARAEAKAKDTKKGRK
jgi:predicted  nucleic acid-binding Zn-ribbon protein